MVPHMAFGTYRAMKLILSEKVSGSESPVGVGEHDNPD
jgi:hypothetical protein